MSNCPGAQKPTKSLLAAVFESFRIRANSTTSPSTEMSRTGMITVTAANATSLPNAPVALGAGLPNTTGGDSLIIAAGLQALSPASVAEHGVPRTQKRLYRPRADFCPLGTARSSVGSRRVLPARPSDGGNTE